MPGVFPGSNPIGRGGNPIGRGRNLIGRGRNLIGRGRNLISFVSVLRRILFMLTTHRASDGMPRLVRCG